MSEWGDWEEPEERKRPGLRGCLSAVAWTGLFGGVAAVTVFGCLGAVPALAAGIGVVGLSALGLALSGEGPA